MRRKGQREAVHHGAGSPAFPVSLLFLVCARLLHGPLLSHGSNVLNVALWETREIAWIAREDRQQRRMDS